jgi:hypothetical protein
VKPLLFHDVDGVLFGLYAGHYQLRPNVKGWLAFAHEHFQVVWLTSRTREDIHQLLKIVYAEKYESEPSIQFRVADWYSCAAKEEWLSANTSQLEGVSWYWIDDRVPPDGRLIHLGLEPRRCLTVDPKGADELVILQARLTQFLDSAIRAT